MVFLSGFAGLVYQVLWMRQLGLLFGNTAYAAGATLAVFFAGLAAGSWFWGRRVCACRHPLRLYAWVELGIAGTALLFFAILRLFYLIYPVVYQSAGAGMILFAVKCLLAAILIFPPAFCMGGTIPAMGHYLIVRSERFAATTAWIYGINTLGAGLGAGLAVFLLVPFLGFNLTCVGAMAITCCVAFAALGLSRSPWQSPPPPATPKTSPARRTAKKGLSKAPGGQPEPEIAGIGRGTIFFLAFVSGFSVLALEVAWTRMFAQVHENSVYSFAAVLVIVLTCISLGALVAAILARMPFVPRRCLAFLQVASGVLVSLSPLLFIKLTGNMRMLATEGSFAWYFTRLFGLGFATMGPACLLLGTVFPFLLKSEERFARHPGRSIGNLSAANTTGAILGSLVCGFVLLETVGMWWTFQLIAAMYLLVGISLPQSWRPGMMVLRAVAVVFLVLLGTGLRPSRLPTVGGDPRRGPQEVLEVWETSGCTVSAVKNSAGFYTIKINSNYILGSTGALDGQIFQAQIPLFIYPDTESIFFLGVGTGITAGGALDRTLFPSVKRVVACEMVAEVITAARRYMAGDAGGDDYTHGLFTDDRVEIVIEDGRHYLMATAETFDMINADLFLPYRSGAGSLYSREHFERSKDRLNPDGVFVQWLPLYQVTDFEFGTIARTMLGVFDQVTLWRNNFIPGSEVVALIGHKNPRLLPACNLPVDREKMAAVAGLTWQDLPVFKPFCNEQTVLLFYGGNLTASRQLFDTYPVNTDDRPVIEYMAPKSLRQPPENDLPPVFIGPRLADLVHQLLNTCPPDKDPMLVDRTAENRRLPLAGEALHHAWIGFALKDPSLCRQAWQRFIREWNNSGSVL